MGGVEAPDLGRTLGDARRQIFHEQIGYISNLELEAAEFLPHIQQHWSIENRLHWVRDVTFEEDYARPGSNAPVNWTILNCFLITIVRQLGYRTVPQGARVLANQVKRVFEFLLPSHQKIRQQVRR